MEDIARMADECMRDVDEDEDDSNLEDDEDLLVGVVYIYLCSYVRVCGCLDFWILDKVGYLPDTRFKYTRVNSSSCANQMQPFNTFLSTVEPSKRKQYCLVAFWSSLMWSKSLVAFTHSL